MTARRLTLAAMCLAAGLVLANGSARPSPAGGAVATYGLRSDPRLCPSPRCGGFWAGRVNWRRTLCRDSSSAATCYVAAVDLSSLDAATRARVRLALGAGRALVEGTFGPYSGALPTLSRLVATRVWLRAGPAAPTGITYRVIDTGIRCVRAPCFSLRATVVNGTRSITLSDLDLAGTGVSPAALAQANDLLAHGGVLASGTIRTPAGGAAGTPGRTFAATQLWLPA